MNPIYLQTHFKRPEQWQGQPYDFAIITACATTGETWTDAQNNAADQQLETELRTRTPWVKRLTGYSPTTGHYEPGWAVKLPFDEACDIGERFAQDAIYYVSGDSLAVSYCDRRRAPVPVGSFVERVHSEGEE